MKKKKKYIVISVVVIMLISVLIGIKASSFIVRNQLDKTTSMIGRYEFAVTGASNTYLRRDNTLNVVNHESGDPVRLPGDGGGRINQYIEGNMNPDLVSRHIGGSGNSSSATLTKPSSNAKVVKAYLMVETMVSDFNDDILARMPVTMKGASGGTIKSNPLYNTIYTGYKEIDDVAQGTKPSVIVSDVTSFVQSQGFGTYQVWDIPYWIKNKWVSGTDHIASWKLVTICEDENLPIRMLNLRYGAQTLQNSPQRISVNGLGIKSKSLGNVTGQLLIGGVGGDPDEQTSHVALRTSPSTDFYDLNTGKSGEMNKTTSFFSGLVSTNGIPNPSVKVLGTRLSNGVPFHNTDLVLMDVNETKSNTANGHNAYFSKDSPQVDLMVYDTDDAHSNTLTLLGLAVDIDTPTYTSSVKHTGQPYQDVDLPMSVHVENNTPTNKMQLGVNGGYATIKVDSNIKLDASSVKATYTDKTDGKKYTLIGSVSGNTIIVPFGKDGNRVSQVGDTLDVTFQGKPLKVMNGYENSVEMFATGFIDESGYTNAFSKTTSMTKSSDTFYALYNNPPWLLTKDRTFYEGQYTKDYWQKTLRWKDTLAGDKEDGDITSKIKVIADTVDVNKAGVYVVTYQVSDKFGKTTTEDAKVTVLYNNPPVITTKDKTFYEGQYTKDYWQDTLRMQDVSATDVEDGDLSAKIKVLSDTVDVHKAGVYKVTYEVKDAFGNSATKDAKVTVLSNTPPVITTVDKTFYEGEYTKEYWQGTLRMRDIKATDVEDGDISSNIKVISDNVDVSKAGNYKVTYEVQDAFGKRASGEAKVTVLFNHPPEIEGVDRWFYVTDDIDDNVLLERVKANDVEDGVISSKISIIQSDVQEHVVGEYKVQYQIIDSFGKSAKTTVKVHIVENNVTGTQTKKLRFIQDRFMDTLQVDSIWKVAQYNELLVSTFAKPKTAYDAEIILTQEDMERIRAFNDQYDYSTNSNQIFYEQFKALWKEENR